MTDSKTILVCDDDPLLLDLLEFRLAARGFNVVVARDGGQAMQRPSHQPDKAASGPMAPHLTFGMGEPCFANGVYPDPSRPDAALG
jgi:CheY-like chemotaxis protein